MMSKKPCLYTWNMNDRELDGFLAVTIYFGIVRITYKKDYWKTDIRRYKRSFMSDLNTKIE